MSKLLIVAAAAGLLIGTTALGYAQSSTQERAPGQRMQERGSVPGHPGASDYAPGQRMHERGSKAGAPGASGYAGNASRMMIKNQIFKFRENCPAPAESVIRSGCGGKKKQGFVCRPSKKARFCL
jgi:hypothetical protein